MQIAFPHIVQSTGAALAGASVMRLIVMQRRGVNRLAVDLRFHGAALRAAVMVIGLALLLAVPHGGWAKDGGSGDSGSGSDHSGSDSSGSGSSGSDDSGSDDSGSGGHGSDDGGSDDSGSSSHGGTGSSSHDGSDDSDRVGGGKSDVSGRGGKDGLERWHTYDGGWRAQIRNGRYQVFDPAGRVVINRKAKLTDYWKF